MKDSLHVSVDTLGRKAGMCPGLLQTHLRREEWAFAHCLGKADQPIDPQRLLTHMHTHTHTQGQKWLSLNSDEERWAPTKTYTRKYPDATCPGLLTETWGLYVDTDSVQGWLYFGQSRKKKKKNLPMFLLCAACKKFADWRDAPELHSCVWAVR